MAAGRLVAPAASSPASRAVMQGDRADSSSEKAVRSELHRRGVRFRKHLAPLPGVRGRPDVVFTRAKIAVFIDGCFWHRCPEHGTSPRTNSPYWQEKLDRNVARDRRNTAAFEQAGWTVLRFWEHEPPAAVAEAVAAAVAEALCP